MEEEQKELVYFTDPIKVEIVNMPNLEDQIRNKLLLAMAGAAGTLLIERGSTWLAKKIIEVRTKKALEAKQPKKD